MKVKDSVEIISFSAWTERYFLVVLIVSVSLEQDRMRNAGLRGKRLKHLFGIFYESPWEIWIWIIKLRVKSGKQNITFI